MSVSNGFHDLLFEMSNENRYEILLILREKSKRITDLTKQMNLTTTEVRRHVTRLTEAGLIQRDIEGYYRLTPYGETSLLLFQELEFLSAHRDYLTTHTLSSVPTRFIKRIGELRANVNISNPLDFIRQTDNLLKESKKYVWLLVDQFPMNSLSSIVDAIERGVQFRIIEPRERVLNPDLDVVTSEETKALSRTRRTPLVEQRMLDQVSVYLIVSDTRCVLAFPNVDGQFDYKGFTATDDLAHQWCAELFQSYWTDGEQRRLVPGGKQVIRRGVSLGEESHGSIIVEGHEDPVIDAQAVQDAVDNYDEVVLKGKFNFGASSVIIAKSVVIRGDGRENDIPETIIYKKGWSFPFREFTGVFDIDADDIDVTIENLNFTDFNCTCIVHRDLKRGHSCNSLKILNNRITVVIGYGRGMTFASFGDFLFGVFIGGVGKGGVVVEGNYIDLAVGGIGRGSVNRGGLEEDPEYRPDLFNHEYFSGTGIVVDDCAGKVEVKNNIVKNASGRGIAVGYHSELTEVYIQENYIESDVYGSYPFSSRESGAGIVAHTGTGQKNLKGFYVCIEKNRIKLDKVNYSGILVLGPDSGESFKLKGGVIRENLVHLRNGYEGIHVRKCDDFMVSDNKISGKAYYGIRVSGRIKPGEIDLRSLNNTVEDNDMSDILIRDPDRYSDNHSDGRRFAGSSKGSTTAHVWLDKFSENNFIKIRKDETVIDEGEDNQIEVIKK
jgi:predicted transcriptional regulator